MDPIADMLTRIKNAQAVSHPTVNVPFSRFKFNLAKILEREKLIEKVDTQGRKARKVIQIKLKYSENKPAIKGFKRVSKPSCRIYLSKADLRKVAQKYGVAIISTSEGLMTEKEALKKGIGGEYVCQVW